MNQTAGHRLRQFFATVAVPCPYLPGRSEQKLVIELKSGDPPGFFDTLSSAGFRRSHGLAYRPACRACRACVPVRIDVARFRASRSLRRVANRNSDLVRALVEPTATDEHYRLFSRYLSSRHGQSEMRQMSYGDYRAMVEDTNVPTSLLEFRDRSGELQAVCLTDRLASGLSAVYSFFAPERASDSLGTAIILALVEEARSRGQTHVYLGYWIDGSATMDYKRRFPALEGLIDGKWRPLPRETA